MQLKFKGIVLFALFGAQSVCAQSSLENARIIAGVSLGYSDFSFPEKLDHNIGFPSINVPVAVTLDQWQLSANWQTSISDADISEEEDIGKASRDDLDITLGYRISNSWTVFSGYKYGNTDVEFTPRDFGDFEVSDGEDEASEIEEPLAISQESYKQEGPFVGVSYSWQFEKAGNLSLTLAYAKLNAINDFSSNTDDDEEDPEEVEFDDITGQVKGDTHGFSYSLGWTMPVSSNLVFQTRFKVNDYKQDIVFNKLRFDDVDERFTSLHVGVAYVF
jgi:hypothetical protein